MRVDCRNRLTKLVLFEIDYSRLTLLRHDICTLRVLTTRRTVMDSHFIYGSHNGSAAS